MPSWRTIKVDRLDDNDADEDDDDNDDDDSDDDSAGDDWWWWWWRMMVIDDDDSDEEDDDSDNDDDHDEDHVVGDKDDGWTDYVMLMHYWRTLVASSPVIWRFFRYIYAYRHTYPEQSRVRRLEGIDSSIV